MQYRTRQNEMLDAICYRYYGKTAEVVEHVLAANSHLADQGAILPEGLIIELPPLKLTSIRQPTLQLWD